MPPSQTSRRVHRERRRHVANIRPQRRAGTSYAPPCYCRVKAVEKERDRQIQERRKGNERVGSKHQE